jgi:hypothetical protein
MTPRGGFSLLCLALSLVSAAAQAVDPDAHLDFPVIPPVRERVLNVDDQASWTLRRGEAAVPLSVVPTSGRTLVALAGGWVQLGPDLEYVPGGLGLLASSGPAGSPWAQAVDDAVVFVTGSPGDLAVVFPDTGALFRRHLEVAGLSFFAVTDQGFLFVQSRRASLSPDWERPLREVQPLPFFPSDLSTTSDGTSWAADSLQARPWRQEDGFWKPLDLPKAPGRLTTLAPFPDSTGYFAGGPGWVGAFASDGSPYWIRDKDLVGQPLPRDLKVRTGAGRLYLWSAQARRVWCWGWNPSGPAGTVGAPSLDRLIDDVRSEVARLESVSSVPEAQATALYGYELAQSVLKSQPFVQAWTKASSEFLAKRQALRDRAVGAGVFSLDWSSPNGLPLASWSWEPDALWSDAKVWRATARPYWEGRPFEAEEFGLAVTAELAPWPGAESYRQGPYRLPSWMNLEFRPDGTDSPVHWTRIPLPSPPIPYDLPVE